MILLEQLTNGYIRTEVTDTRIIVTYCLSGVLTRKVTVL